MTATTLSGVVCEVGLGVVRLGLQCPIWPRPARVLGPGGGPRPERARAALARPSAVLPSGSSRYFFPRGPFHRSLLAPFGLASLSYCNAGPLIIPLLCSFKKEAVSFPPWRSVSGFNPCFFSSGTAL